MIKDLICTIIFYIVFLTGMVMLARGFDCIQCKNTASAMNKKYILPGYTTPCMIEISSGKWIPLKQYRVIE